MCGDCRRSVIDTPEELEEVRKAALAIITRHIGPNNLELIPVRLKKELAPGETSGRLGVAMSREDLTLLLLESGLPESFAISVLCHEFGHAILFRDHQTLVPRPSAGTHAIQVEEGFCQVLNALALQTRHDPIARFQGFLLPASPDEVYGDGFRLMWQAARDAGSVAALLEQLTGDPIAFRGPAVEMAVDEGDDFGDLIPVVSGGGGDPTKGPLRGSALKPEDAPKDVPRGPRLRGTALTVQMEKETETGSGRSGLRGTGLALAKVKELEASESKSSRLRGKGL